MGLLLTVPYVPCQFVVVDLEIAGQSTLRLVNVSLLVLTVGCYAVHVALVLPDCLRQFDSSLD